jgi:hypothetical protein
MTGRFSAMTRFNAGARRRGILVLAMCALLALVVEATAATAGSDDPTAAVAKKKCKKGKKSAVAAKKKKKCKSKKKQSVAVTVPVTPPSPTTPTGPTVRATLTWEAGAAGADGAADLDLYAWTTDGASSETSVQDASSLIPSTSFSADAEDGPGPETFTDHLAPSTRNFSFGICGDDVMEDTDFTITATDPSGNTFSFNQDTPGFVHITMDGDSNVVVFPGGFTPMNWCDA